MTALGRLHIERPEYEQAKLIDPIAEIFRRIAHTERYSSTAQTCCVSQMDQILRMASLPISRYRNRRVSGWIVDRLSACCTRPRPCAFLVLRQPHHGDEKQEESIGMPSRHWRLWHTCQRPLRQVDITALRQTKRSMPRSPYAK
jgi:hypothetical protein